MRVFFVWRRTQAGIFIAVASFAIVGIWLLAAEERFSLPAFFMSLAAAMMVFALAALWQSLRAVFGERALIDVGAVTLPERAALVDEKNSLLRAIKDIAFENEVGKLSDEEFERLDRAYRSRAKDVLRKLDEDLLPFLERAQQMVDRAGEAAPKPKAKKKAKKRKGEVRACPQCRTTNALDAEECKVCGARLAPSACPQCGASNAPDANFCNKCAAPLGSAGKEEADTE